MRKHTSILMPLDRLQSVRKTKDGRPLDGAQFKITVEFTDGTKLVEEGWEVDNGARLFTWTHPKDNHESATVTIEETKAPRYYTLDPTPQTVTRFSRLTPELPMSKPGLSP